MKRKSTMLLLPLSDDAVMSLVSQVKETVAAGYKKMQCTALSNADLWNIQRNRRVRPGRRWL